MMRRPLRRPLIGITSADDPHPENYVKAIERCGGEAIVLRNLPEQVEEDLRGIRGLLITGGSDLDPARYGEAAHEATAPGDAARDAYELAAVLRAFELKIPTLAICRGMQIANVAWGGSLYQHLPDLPEVIAGGVIHRDDARKYVAFEEHIVSAAPGSLIAKFARSVRFATNATHHQAVARLGAGLHAVARTSDGIVEALERSDAPMFWLAVQWHPERLLDVDNGRSKSIIEAFVTAAASFGEDVDGDE